LSGRKGDHSCREKKGGGNRRRQQETKNGGASLPDAGRGKNWGLVAPSLALLPEKKKKGFLDQPEQTKGKKKVTLASSGEKGFLVTAQRELASTTSEKERTSGKGTAPAPQARTSSAYFLMKRETKGKAPPCK